LSAKGLFHKDVVEKYIGLSILPFYGIPQMSNGLMMDLGFNTKQKMSRGIWAVGKVLR
jgi:hypothetical protein